MNMLFAHTNRLLYIYVYEHICAYKSMFNHTYMKIGVTPDNDILIEVMRSHMVVVIIGLLLMAYVAAAGRIMYPYVDLCFLVTY